MRSLFLLLVLTIVFSCSNPSDQLIGKWTATAIIQDNEALDIDLEAVSFTFQDNSTYEFTSTLEYREAGAFQVSDNMLITKDTINGQGQKSVMIKQLDSDTLKLRMKNPAGWMEVTLAKE